MCFGHVGIRVKLNPHLLVKKRAGVGMGGFEISDQISNQIVVTVAILLEQQMPIVADFARIFRKPSCQRSFWWSAIV